MARNRKRSARSPLACQRLEDRVNPGGGTFDATTGTFNFSVALRFTATDAEMTLIERAFQTGSDVIADATDGQHRFGTVTIVNNAAPSNEAEYWIFKQDGRAFATVGLYGVRGQHVTMYLMTTGSNAGLFDVAAPGDGYTVAHEFAHHAYGILDEYSGPPVDAAGNPATRLNAPASAESATLNYSLMDNYKTRGGRGTSPRGNYTLNEFSVASNHDPDNDTYQSIVNRRNDWAQVATNYPVVIPAGLPNPVAPASQPVTFNRNAVNVPHTVLLLENTSNVATNASILKLGTVLYLQTAKETERVGVLHFNSGVNITNPFRTMTDTNRQAAIDATNALPGSTDPVAEPVEAVKVAETFLNGASPQSTNKVIVLVGTGVGTAQQNLLDLVPFLNQENISVISVLVNPNPTAADVDRYQSLATRTGGKYFRISTGSAEEYAALFSAFSSERQGNGLLTKAPPENLSAGGTIQQFVTVEPGTPEVTLGSAPLFPGGAFAVTLISPSGVPISAPGPGVGALATGTIVGFRISNPEAGVWTIQTTAGAADVGPVSAIGLRPDDPYRVHVHATSAGVTYPSPVTLTVTPTFEGIPVFDATVNGLMTRPDGSQSPVFFFDDGLPASGDLFPDDGVYTARFTDFSPSGNGSYTVNVLVNGFTAMTFAGETALGDGTEPPSTPQPVPPFTRTGSETFEVVGVPATVVSNDLAVTLTPSGDRAVVLTVMNNGANEATGLTARAFLGGAVRALSGQANQGTFTIAPGQVTFSVGSLAPGAAAMLTFTVLPDQSGLYNLIAEVDSSGQVDPLLVNNEAFLPIPLIRSEILTVGSDAGLNRVLLSNRATGATSVLTPFSPLFTGGVRVASADFTGDGIPEVVVGAGPGGAPTVVIYDGATENELRRFDAFESSFGGGVFVALGDINGDGYAELVVTPDLGGGPCCRVFDGRTGTQLADFYGIDDPNFRGGARAAIADVNGDGRGDLVVAAGFGGGPRLAVFDGSKLSGNGGPKLFGDFFAFEESVRNGVFIAAGDVNGDGFADLIAGGGPGGGPRVFALSGQALTQNGSGTLVPLGNFFAGDPNSRGGVRLAVKDYDGDGRADLLTGAGSGAGSRVTAYLGNTLSAVAPPPAFEFDAFAGFAGGVFVG